jgi:alkanesulfonate monooxygenase SsuD/methylene tetrahydromethanopterin reductase-like flavin-dependent oxidoreductase (luciferase family)
MPIQFGLALDFLSARRPLPVLLEEYAALLELAEKYGFDSVWAGENRPSAAQPGHLPSPLLALAAIAARTRLRLGTGVLLAPLWNPLHLAYDCAVLDQICGGRLILGVGAGAPYWMKRYGLPPEQMAARMDETLRALRRAWAGEISPAPVQAGGPPIWVGGKIRRSAERAAELGDGWYAATQYHLDVIGRQAALYRERWAALGRDPAAAVVAVNRTTFVAETDDAARREGRRYVAHVLDSYRAVRALTDGQGADYSGADLFETLGKEHYFCGSAETCAAQIAEYAAAGVTRFHLRVSMGDMPIELARRTVRLLGQRVLPNFR